MDLAEAWEGLKQKYTDFLDSLEEKGVPSPRVIVPAAAIIILLAIVLLVLPAITTRTQTVSLFVKDASGNPIAGARVTMLANGSPAGSLTAGSDGKVVFTGLPLGVSLRAFVEAENYTQQEVEVTAAEATVLLQPAAPPGPQVVRVNVRDSITSNNVAGIVVELLFDDGASYSDITGADGIVEFASLPEIPEHATLRVDDSQYEATQKDFSKEQSDLVVVQLTPKGGREDPLAGEGTVFVAVDYEGQPVEGITVTLTDPSTDAVLRSGSTGSDGIAAIEEVEAGARFYLSASDSNGKYLTYNSPDYYEYQLDNQTVYASLKQKTVANSDEIAISVTSKSGSALSGAEVNVFNRVNGRFLEKGNTDSSGVFKIAVAKGISLYLTAWKEGYLPSFLSGVTAGATRTIALDEAAAGNYAELIVSASYLEAPVSGASVSLYKADGTFLGIPVLLTESDGAARTRVPKRFSRIFAKVSREGYEGKSDIIPVIDPMSINVTLSPQKSTVSVIVLDVSNNQQVKNAVVAAVSGETEVSSCEAAQGTCTLTGVTADEDIFLKASAPGYDQYSSSTVRLAPGEKRTSNVYLYPTALSGAVSARFLGLFNSQGAVREVANGETYQARFLVTMPRNIGSGGLNVRVGSKSTAQEDVAFIRDFDARASKTIYSSATFSPDQECTFDTPTNGTLEPVKWVDFQFQKGFVGTKEISVSVKVAGTAKAGESVEVNYRAYAVSSNTPAMSPTDEATLTSLLQKTSQEIPLIPADFCQAKTFTEKIPVTSEPLVCDDKICFKASFEDQDGFKGRPGAFEVELGKDFTVRYEVLAQYAVDSVSIQSDYADFKGITASELTFATDQTVPISAPAGSKYAAGFMLKATTTGAGAFATITVHSPEAETKQYRLNFKVTGKDSFSISTAPAVVFTGERSAVKVSVKDKLGLDVSSAVITLHDCDASPLGGREIDVVGDGSKNLGENGIYTILVEPTSPGMIGIRIAKEGFKTLDKCDLPVEGADFLEVNPDVLDPFTGDSRQPAERKQLEVTNLLSTKARVSTSVQCSGAPNSIVSVTPQGFNLKEKGTAAVFVSLRQNVTADAVCIIHFAGKINNQIVSEIDVPIQVSVQGPQPAVPIPGVLSLTNPVQLWVDETGYGTATYSIAHLQGVTGAQVRLAPPRGYASRQNYQLGWGGLYDPTYGSGFGYDLVYTSLDFDKKTLTLSANMPPESFAQSQYVIGSLVFTTTGGGTIPTMPVVIRKWSFVGVGFGLSDCGLPGLRTVDCETIPLYLTSQGYYLTGSVGPRTYIICGGQQVPLNTPGFLIKPCRDTIAWLRADLGVGGLAISANLQYGREGQFEPLPRKISYLVYQPGGYQAYSFKVSVADRRPAEIKQDVDWDKTAKPGEKIKLTARVKDSEGQPLVGIPVEFVVTQGPAAFKDDKESVESDTNNNGVAEAILSVRPDAKPDQTIRVKAIAKTSPADRPIELTEVEIKIDPNKIVTPTPIPTAVVPGKAPEYCPTCSEVKPPVVSPQPTVTGPSPTPIVPAASPSVSPSPTVSPTVPTASPSPGLQKPTECPTCTPPANLPIELHPCYKLADIFQIKNPICSIFARDKVKQPNCVLEPTKVKPSDCETDSNTRTFYGSTDAGDADVFLTFNDVNDLLSKLALDYILLSPPDKEIRAAAYLVKVESNAALPIDGSSLIKIGEVRTKNSYLSLPLNAPSAEFDRLNAAAPGKFALLIKITDGLELKRYWCQRWPKGTEIECNNFRDGGYRPKLVRIKNKVGAVTAKPAEPQVTSIVEGAHFVKGKYGYCDLCAQSGSVFDCFVDIDAWRTGRYVAGFRTGRFEVPWNITIPKESLDGVNELMISGNDGFFTLYRLAGRSSTALDCGPVFVDYVSATHSDVLNHNSIACDEDDVFKQVTVGVASSNDLGYFKSPLNFVIGEKTRFFETNLKIPANTPRVPCA